MPDGSVLTLSDGQLRTEEGCSSISDINGNLLFYTDGKTVWDRNHIIMPNGTNLFGDPSSTQSGIIVPKPNNANIYYIFTVDEPHHENAAVYPNGFTGTYTDPNSLNVPDGDDGFNNGFNYSIVDLSIAGTNGSIGDVISKNNHLITYNANPNGEEIKYKCSEKITAVGNSSDSSFWVVTHFIDRFFAFKVDGSGVNTNPVISTVGSYVGTSGYRRNAIGYLKASPNGEKLAIAHNQKGVAPGSVEYATGKVELYDFDTASGVVSNPVEVIPDVMAYGIEFSSSSEKLYATYRTATYEMELAQFNLLSSNVPASKTVIHTQQNYLAGLQLAPNNKIYCAVENKNSLSVINTPDADGLLCSFVLDDQPLTSDRFVKQGLPPFITSFFFVPAIQLENACAGQNTTFEFNTSQSITSAVWNFGDGATSNALSPVHVYSSPGNYTVSVNVSGPNGTGTNTREITIYPLPVLSSNTVNLKQCDDDNDGFSAFNLNEVVPILINNTAGLTFSFHESLQDAEDNASAITNTTSYTNQTVSNDTVFIRVENGNGCYETAQINLLVSTTLIPSSFQKVFAACDDAASGSNTDGLALFDFSSVTTEVQALYPAGQLLDITYYRNLADALAEINAITDVSNYTNIGYPYTQNIFVRVDSQVNNECLGLGHHITLNVEQIPIVQPLKFNHCDNDQDGIYGFDTANLETTLLNGLTNVSVAYRDENNNLLPSPLPNPFPTATKTITATVTNLTPQACSFTTTIGFVVDDLPEIFAIPANLTSVCDDESDPAFQDGVFAFDTSTFNASILGNQTGMTVNYFDQNGNPLPSPLPNPFVSGTQNLTVEVINTINNSCTANSVVSLVVNPLPIIDLLGDELICSDNPHFTKTINAGLADASTVGAFTYKWFFNGTEIPSETNYTLVVNTEGTYEVEVQNIHGCTITRTITVVSSNKATIDAIEVVDLSENNSITVIVSGQGNYVYSLDNENFQESDTFYNLNAGIYTVYVMDLNRCGTRSEEVSVLGIPKFFTPNGDGYNDHWNIKGFNPNINSKATISIFDRYGKMLKQFNPMSGGWDGTYNGNLMPSTDYWYTVQLEDGRSRKGHFSLRR